VAGSKPTVTCCAWEQSNSCPFRQRKGLQIVTCFFLLETNLRKSILQCSTCDSIFANMHHLRLRHSDPQHTHHTPSTTIYLWQILDRFTTVTTLLQHTQPPKSGYPEDSAVHSLFFLAKASLLLVHENTITPGKWRWLLGSEDPGIVVFRVLLFRIPHGKMVVSYLGLERSFGYFLKLFHKHQMGS
jgi:hypothetical protein